MTVREYFRRRSLLYAWAFRALMPLLILALAAGFTVRREYPLVAYSLLVLAAAQLLWPAFKGLGFGFCPRCGVNFDDLMAASRRRGEKRPFWDVWTHCPQCGLNFDDPRPR